jgi:hypothetical protein
VWLERHNGAHHDHHHDHDDHDDDQFGRQRRR